MAQFNWKAQNPTGCPFCGASVVPEGFVDCIGDTHVMDAEGNIVGFVDVVVCATCVRQMGDLVGCIQPEQRSDLENRLLDAEESEHKLKDEVQAWQQRFNNLVDAISRGAGVDDNPDLALAGVVSSGAGIAVHTEANPAKEPRTRKRKS